MNSTANASAAQVEGLTKTYGDTNAVNNVSFTVPEKGVVGLIGPNGCGKTTTMKMMLGLVRPTNGRVEMLGAPSGGAGWSGALRRVGSMIEDPPIYQRMTARQNLRYQSMAVTGRVDDDEINRLLTLVDLADRADDRPRAYSLGMKQRLGIAITLVGSPELIILDEPANGLDPAGIREIRNLLQRLPETGTTVLVSSHQLAEVQQACDSLVILAKGNLIASGSTQSILDASTSNLLRVEVRPDQLPEAIQVLSGASCAVQPNTDGTMSVEPTSDMAGADVNRLLANAGIYASEIARESVSLEQAFLTMTEGADAPAPPARPESGVVS